MHGPFSSSKRLMRILGEIVEPTTDLLAIGVADLFHRRGIRAKPVGDDGPRSAVFLHDALEKLQCRRLVPLRGDDRLQNLAFMVDSAPEIAELASRLAWKAGFLNSCRDFVWLGERIACRAPPRNIDPDDRDFAPSLTRDAHRADVTDFASASRPHQEACDGAGRRALREGEDSLPAPFGKMARRSCKRALPVTPCP